MASERSSNATGSLPDAASALQVWLPMKPAPPVTRTVSIDQLCFQHPLNEVSPGKGGFCVSIVSIVCTASLGVRSGPLGLIARTVLTMLTMPHPKVMVVCQRRLSCPLMRYPSGCRRPQSIPPVLERFCPNALILIIRAPD